MKINPELPSYEELFGEVDLKKADDARSVYSPAAYLADLIQLLDDKFEYPKFNQENRRVDIKELPLDSENTYISIPYLNIVNDVLENVLAIKLEADGDLYGKLKTAKYPFHLPFNFDNERIKKFINYLKVTAEQLYKLFSLQVEPDIVAREYLGLSLEDYELITGVVPEGTLRQYFDDKSFDDLKDVAQFITITGLSGQEFRELLYQDLSEKAKNSESITERVKASEFFINYQLNGYAKLDQTEENIVWQELDQSESTTSIPVSWYERVNRFVRLAKKIQLSFTDLDIILRRCCQNTLDAEAVRTIAVIKQIHDLYELPIDVVCSFFSDINSLGIGSDKEPKDLFNRVFNSKFATLEQEYIRVGEFIPEKYADYARLTCSGDLLSFNNKDYRSRLQKTLDISDKDLTYVVNKFRDRTKGDESKTSLLAKDQNMGLPALSLLFRISKLTEVLDISYEDLFNLLDILEKDPSIRTYSNFNILINPYTQEQDCYHILEGESDLSSSMWLVQVLFAVTDWMHTNDFTSEELKYVLTGQLKDQTETESSIDEKINVLNTLYQNFKSVILEADLFESDRFDSRSARVIHLALTGEGSKVVSKKDRRLVIYDQRSVEQLAYTALNQLEMIKKEDFMHLGLEQKMRDKIFNNMIIKGYINPEGSLNEEILPQSAHDFQIETDFSGYKEEVFTLIYGLFTGAVESTDFDEEDEDIENDLDDETIATLEFSVYPSDLEEIEDLSQAHRDELYDNLIFNGYIDEEGNVLQPDFFALAENAADFKVNTPIAAYSTDVFNLISAQVNKFNEERLILDQEIFSALPLNAMEIDDLMENLKFNEYINSDNVLTNKQELLAQDVKGFKLALPFYPHRHKILNTIKELITEFKSYFYTLTPESLAGIADQIVAEQIYKMIESDYLQDGRLKEDKKAFFLDQDNVEQFTVGSYFTPIDTAVIFSTLGEIIAGYQKYQLITKPLDELDFNLEEREELMDVLETNGYGIEQGKIPEEKVEYFLNSNNALDFTLDKFEDYNKDIFFVLHAIAKEIDASVREISENVKMLAEKQERVVLETLQDAFGIDAEIVKAVCQQVFRDGETIVEEFLIPVFALVNSQDVISAEPNNQKFNLAYRRILQFARLAAKLRLSQEETEVVFHEQDLVEKFPEKLVLPDTIDRFDALLEHPDGVIYIFKDDNYWAYSAETYNLVETKDNTSETKDNKLTSLSDKFAGLTKIDAAFTDKQGTSFIIAGGNCYCNEKGSKRWIEKDRVWGKVKSNFDDPEKVEAAFQDKQGRTYLFAGDQYIRYSGNDYDHVDEGYPLTIAGNWKTELSNAHLPQEFQESIDAAFQGTNDKSYLFKGSKFVCSDNLSIEMDINQTWGKVKNNFKASKKIDAAYADGGNLLVFVGNQVMLYQDSLENDQVKGLEGFPKLIKSHYPNVPSEFADGVDAAFKGEDGKIHLFKDGMVVSFESNQASQASMTVVQVKEQWGVVRNTILESGRVDAAFVSLEGKTYLFSGNQYFQYSGSDYSQVDEGFPRTIAGDWGGLNTVDAAFVLDGKTYLFGKTGAASDHVVYVRYSQNDYTKPDEGYPQEPNDNWWNLPFNLVQEGADFNQIDAVFTSNDHKTYLFSGDKFIYFDHQQRWWSEPQLLSTHWDSIPFASVDAAFMGRDGKTYLFSGSEYVKYSSPNYSKIDDRYPNITNRYWGNVVNNIAKTGNVDAAIVVESREMIDDVEQTTVHTYLFSGNQYFRYKGNHYDAVEEGYPKYIVPSLKDEPRFKNLNVSYENGIDAAFADRRTIYLFKQTEGYVVSETLSKKYDDLGFTQVDCAFIDQGALFVAENATWHRYSSLEGKAIQKTAVEPPRLREVPSKFKTGLDAVLQGIDRNTYLFKGQDCFNVLLNKEYPLAEEWGRERNTIYINNTVDAAFVGRDGKTYLFSGDQYVTYAGDTYIKAEIEDTPKPIQEKWGGLTSVALAFVKDDKTYLFEKADDEGKFRYLCYSTDDYTQPDPGFPQTAEPDFLQIPATYTEEGFNQIDAVLFEADNMFVLSENRYIQFNFTENQWAYPRPLDRIWRGIPLNHDSFARVKTAFTGRDGATYFFADNYYVKYENVKDENNRFTSPALIQEDWGIVHNNFVNNSPDNKIDAACVWQNKITYLVSGDQYVRYSGKDYRYVDEGYPKQIANHLRREAGFENLPEDFEEIVSNRIANGENRIIDAIIANHRTLYIFMGSHCYVVSQTLDAVYDIDIIGNIKNTILQKNQVDAAFVNERGQTFLFSGDQGVRYSDDRYDTVDDGYPQPIATVLTTELGISTMPEMFQYGIDAALRGRDGNLYLFKNEDYLSSAESEPKLIKETWGKVKNNFISHPGAIDAAFVAPDHHLYVFKGDQYIRYHDAEQEFVDAGYPHAIKDNWGNLPINFEESIDGGFVFEGKTYLLKGDDYVRYSDSRYQYIDSIYPQTFKYRWGDWADYRLSDIKTIARFKQLQDGYSNGDYSLTDFLHPEKGLVKDPYKMLAEMFGWDSDDVKWLKRNNGFLGTDNRFEVRFNLEMVIKFVDVFSVTEKMGTSPAKLYTEVWQKMYPPSDLGAAADTLYKLLGLLNS